MFSQQVQQRISNQLSWSVIGDVASAMNGNKFCANCIWIAFQILLKVGLLTIGKHMLMFKKQQMLIYAMLKNGLLQYQRFRIRNTAKPSHMKWRSGCAHECAGKLALQLG
jgi:hypothetical protein